MSGYLRSLSAQALGLAASVKSAARLPYAAVPMMFETPTGDEATSPPAAAGISFVAPSNAADRPALTDIPSSRRDYAAVPTIFEQPTVNELHPVRAMREPADQSPAAPSMTQPAAFGPAELIEPTRVPTLVPLVQPATRVVLPPAFASASSAGSARTPSVYRHPTDGEATEVHVSIGRIEVTAVHEASPPPRRAVPVKKSMPLNEYLAQRQRGRP